LKDEIIDTLICIFVRILPSKNAAGTCHCNSKYRNNRNRMSACRDSISWWL